MSDILCTCGHDINEHQKQRGLLIAGCWHGSVGSRFCRCELTPADICRAMMERAADEREERLKLIGVIEDEP